MIEQQTDGGQFTPQQVANIVAYLNILARIHLRLISEGYTIAADGIYKADDDKLADNDKVS
jgi:hypothetical protein